VRVALVHDWLTGMRGGERVLEALVQRFPRAELYTLVHVPGSVSKEIESLPIHTSALSRVPGVARHYRKLLPLFPWAARSLRLTGYDLVVSVHHAVAKSVSIAPGTPHLCYCLTPMRYIWDQRDAYMGSGPTGGLRRMAAAPLAAALRRFDVRTSGAGQVTHYSAISSAVGDRVARHYGRRACVVHPPVDVERIQPNGRAPDDFFLLVGAFVPYKMEELALEAFRDTARRLVVVGNGPTRRALQSRAPKNVEFRGYVEDAELEDLYARCRALIYPQEEDFGLVAVEAQAAGRPVIAYGRGGAADTVRPLLDTRNEDDGSPPTGIWFGVQSVKALRAGLERFEALEASFDPVAIRRHAEGFSRARFDRAFDTEIAHTLNS